MVRRLALALSAALLLAPAAPAFAQDQPATPMDLAAQRVREYLATVPNMPKDILVIPAAGDVPWPGAVPADNVRAEVWLVVSRDDQRGKPLMMFAVKPQTGEVYAMFMVNLQKTTRYR